MRGNADNNRSTVVWTKSVDDDSSMASLSSTRKTSEISLISSIPDAANGDRGHDSVSSITSKVYQTSEQRPSSCRTNEPRRSKSRVRTYLKRCKDAIIGTTTQIDSQPDQSSSIASLDEIRPTATSSWYVNELFLNRNEVNESSATVTPNADLSRCGEIECVVSSEETAAIVEEISLHSTKEIDENTFGFEVSACERCLVLVNDCISVEVRKHYRAKSCLKIAFLSSEYNELFGEHLSEAEEKENLFQLNTTQTHRST